MSGSARNPSSVISLTNEFGVQSDWTLLRDTFGRKVTAWVTSYRRFNAAGVQMLPLRALTTTIKRLAPSRSPRYSLNVCVYSWPSGSCFSNPASMRSLTAKQAMTTVNSTRVSQHETPVTEQRIFQRMKHSWQLAGSGCVGNRRLIHIDLRNCEMRRLPRSPCHVAGWPAGWSAHETGVVQSDLPVRRVLYEVHIQVHGRHAAHELAFTFGVLPKRPYRTNIPGLTCHPGMTVPS